MSNGAAANAVDGGFVANYTVQPSGATTWAEDGGAGVALDPNLPVQVTEWREGWAHFVCSNGWAAWVDGRALVPMASASPEEDELYLTLSDALTRYRDAANAAAAGQITADEFRRQAFAIGHIVKDDVAWMLDIANQQWVRYDGISVVPVKAPTG